MEDHGLFITGTDTGVGKTYCAVALVRELKGRGLDVGVMKPVETGCRQRDGKLLPSDASKLIKAAGTQDDLSVVNPYRFSNPLAPSLAAELAGEKIRKNKLLQRFRALVNKHEYMIVEGAGGIMVPLADRYSYLDLAADIALPVLVIARPGLGTINHTLLTIQALKQRSLKIAGIVINYAVYRRRGLAERTGPHEIERISGVSILGTLGHGSEEVEGIVDSILSSRNRGRRG